MQTFDVESATYSINDMRTVVLRKSSVEINGENKQIVMIRDISDRFKLEEEQAKKKKEAARTFTS